MIPCKQQAADPATPFRGYYRSAKGQPWEALAENTDYGTCLDALLDAIADRRGGESLVTRTNPNGRRQF